MEVVSLSIEKYKTMAKPFVKWAGGKGKLLRILEENLPADFDDIESVTYIEPFVGGGAMLFHMLENHPNINRAIINDINPALINCYLRIKSNHRSLIAELREIHEAYYKEDTQEGRRLFYYMRRNEYNQIPVNRRNTIRSASLFIFLNRTCFNGLYRENNSGGFNVPVGRYIRPTICNEEGLLIAHQILQNVEIISGSYENVMQFVDWGEYNFFYFDPPYRPLLGANNFKQYTLNAFNDPEQEELKAFCDEINAHGGHFMLSNSDREIEPGVSYFEYLYEGYDVQHIYAPRTINAFAPGVQMATEILVKNY